MKHERPKRREPKAAFSLPEPHEDLFSGYGGGLDRLRVAITDSFGTHGAGSLFAAPGPTGSDRRWFDARIFEALCTADQELSQILEQADVLGYPQSLPAIEAAITRVFEDHFITGMLNRFYETAPLIASYFAAKAAHYRLHPEEKDEHAEDPV